MARRQAQVISRRGRAWDARQLRQTQLASLMGLTAPSITKWARRGCPRNEDRTYDLAAVCKWLREGGLDLRRVPQQEILRLVGVSKPSLGDWQRRGCPRNQDRSYDARAVVRWRLAELEKRIAEARKLSARETAQTRRAETDAAMRELDLAERQGQLLSRPAVVAGWVARYQTLKASLSGMIGRLAGAGLSAAQVNAVRAEVDGMLRRLAAGQVPLQLTPREAAAIASVVRPPPAAEEAEAK